MVDAIDAAIDSVATPVESTPAPEGTSNETPASTEASMDARLEEIYDRLNPPRAPDGKFASRTGNNPVSVEPTEEGQELTDQPPQETEGQQQEPPAAVTEPPQAWSAAQKELWASIPPAAQEFVAKREAEAHKAITRMGNQLAQFRPLNELLVTRKDTFARHGVDPQAGISRLLDVQDSLDNEPYAAIAAIAEAYGVDLAAFAGQHQQQYVDEQGNPVQPDPVISSLQQEVRQLTQRLTERERTELRERERQTQDLQRQTDEEVGKWANGKDYFDEPAVKQMMAAAIGNGTAETLDEAYDMACNAIPSIRQKIRDGERKAEDAKRAEEQRKKAAEAKRANTVNVGSSARRVASVPSGKWDSDSYLENTYDRVSGG
jgi:hypothetical protein